MCIRGAVDARDLVSQYVEQLRLRAPTRSSGEADAFALAADSLGSMLERYSDAMNPEARCRVARLCLEGSKSRNRLRLGRFRDLLPSRHRRATRHRASGFIASE